MSGRLTPRKVDPFGTHEIGLARIKFSSISTISPRSASGSSRRAEIVVYLHVRHASLRCRPSAAEQGDGKDESIVRRCGRRHAWPSSSSVAHTAHLRGSSAWKPCRFACAVAASSGIDAYAASEIAILGCRINVT